MRSLLAFTLGLTLLLGALSFLPEPASAQVAIPNPIGSCNTATCLITRVIRYVLGLIAIIATLMFIWGGILMLTSGGNENRVTQAKETLAWAAIGIIVIILSWTIIRFVIESLVSDPGNANGS